MKRIFRNLFFFAFMIFFSSCRPEVLDAVSSSFAKEYCSCLFVEKQSKDYCKSYATQILPISSFQTKKEEIVVMAFGKEARAEFRGKRLGCRLVY